MIKFAFYIHNHQPVGNFDEVFEFAYTHSYLPLLTQLEKHKKIKFGIHNSGPLLEWISEKHPEYFDLLKEVVNRGQVEILTSAYSEPILSLIPYKDAVDQIKYFNDYIYKHFGCVPKGLWLTERVWESELIPALIDAGIEYTLLDDTIFLHAGLEENVLHSYYVTEKEGRVLKLFPISMKLRYLIPFHAVDETIVFLKDTEREKNHSLKVLGDDGEKFGVWPGTHDWVFKHGWLETFLSRLEQEPWIKTVFLSEMTREPSAGRIYLPPASYEEMGEWVLPPEIGKQYEELKKTTNRKYYRLIHGGYFKNFLRKYPEANLMHKRMLSVSKNIGNNSEMKLALWRGQCSCAYWHGIFGGLYLPHLREAIYKNLITAEYAHREGKLTSYDYDTDGEDEIVFSNENFFAVMKPRPAAFIELDDRVRKMNILNYLSRREENYHKKIAQKTEQKEVKSIHETFHNQEKDLARYLIYDTYERGFCLDRLLDKKPSVEDFRHGRNIGTLLDYTNFEIMNEDTMSITFKGRIEKHIEIIGDKKRMLQITYQGHADLFGVEFSLGIFGKKPVLNGNKSLLEASETNNIREFTIVAEGISPITFCANEMFQLLTYPIETISSSEAGLEKNVQGFGLLLIFKKLPVMTIAL